MNEQDIKKVFERVMRWPAQQQREAAEMLLALEADEGEFYHPTEDEWAAIQQGMLEADRGEFATDKEIEELFRKWGK